MTIVELSRYLLGMAMLLTWSVLAQAEHTGSGPQFEQSMAPEERARLQRELNEYSDRAYPDRQRIEARRQQMRERQHRRIESRGGITRNEARQQAPWLERNFERIDRNLDGIVSEDELRAIRKK
jgi:hypothetical protein